MGLTTYLFLWTPIKVVFELFVQYHCPLNFLTGIFCVVYIGFLLLWCQLPCRVYWSLIMATYGDSGVMADWDSLWELRAWPVSLWWPRARPPNGCQSEVVLASSGPHQNFFFVLLKSSLPLNTFWVLPGDSQVKFITVVIRNGKSYSWCLGFAVDLLSTLFVISGQCSTCSLASSTPSLCLTILSLLSSRF